MTTNFQFGVETNLRRISPYCGFKSVQKGAMTALGRSDEGNGIGDSAHERVAVNFGNELVLRHEAGGSSGGEQDGGDLGHRSGSARDLDDLGEDRHGDLGWAFGPDREPDGGVNA